MIFKWNSFPCFHWKLQTHCLHAASVQCHNVTAYQAANPSHSHSANRKIPFEFARLLFFLSIKKTFFSLVHTCSDYQI